MLDTLINVAFIIDTKKKYTERSVAPEAYVHRMIISMWAMLGIRILFKLIVLILIFCELRIRQTFIVYKKKQIIGILILDLLLQVAMGVLVILLFRYFDYTKISIEFIVLIIVTLITFFTQIYDLTEVSRLNDVEMQGHFEH